MVFKLKKYKIAKTTLTSLLKDLYIDLILK